MPRDKNPKKTVKITISTTREMADLLTSLNETGLYGQTRTAAAETLLGEKIRELFGKKILDSIPIGQHKQGGNP